MLRDSFTVVHRNCCTVTFGWYVRRVVCKTYFCETDRQDAHTPTHSPRQERPESPQAPPRMHATPHPNSQSPRRTFSQLTIFFPADHFSAPPSSTGTCPQRSARPSSTSTHRPPSGRSPGPSITPNFPTSSISALCHVSLRSCGSHYSSPRGLHSTWYLRRFISTQGPPRAFPSWCPSSACARSVPSGCSSRQRTGRGQQRASGRNR